MNENLADVFRAHARWLCEVDEKKKKLDDPTVPDANLKTMIDKMAVEAKAAQGVAAQLREWADELTKHDFNWIAAQLLVTADAIENGADVAEDDPFGNEDDEG
jgi:hypothetical protein